MKRTPQRRLHVYWSGRVQGVGFRYTAEAEALGLNLTGWVRNLKDGRVEAVCEGPAAALEGFLESIAGGPMRSNIRQTQVFWEDPTGEFDDFQVRFF